MTKGRLSKALHDLARIERYPFLKRFHHRAGERALWAFNRDAVARGVAVGLFFGILTPVAQIVFALLVAVALRANLLVAAGSTLITNPFIMPFVYYFAYRIGASVTGRSTAADVAVSEEAAEHALDVAGWAPTLFSWASTIGLPLVIGVLTLALSTALLGYLLVHAAWMLLGRSRRETPPAGGRERVRE
jgi:hypothetical protein